jgi:hypothetical protein
MAQQPEDKNIKFLEKDEKVQNPKIRTFNIRGIT